MASFAAGGVGVPMAAGANVLYSARLRRRSNESCDDQQHQRIGKVGSANHRANESFAHYVTNRQVDQVVQLVLEVHHCIAQDLEFGGSRHRR